jgi:hypothetical protein
MNRTFPLMEDFFDYSNNFSFERTSSYLLGVLVFTEVNAAVYSKANLYYCVCLYRVKLVFNTDRCKIIIIMKKDKDITF